MPVVYLLIPRVFHSQSHSIISYFLFPIITSSPKQPKRRLNFSICLSSGHPAYLTAIEPHGLSLQHHTECFSVCSRKPHGQKQPLRPIQTAQREVTTTDEEEATPPNRCEQHIWGGVRGSSESFSSFYLSLHRSIIAKIIVSDATNHGSPSFHKKRRPLNTNTTWWHH
jgi:hypothetical protein